MARSRTRGTPREGQKNFRLTPKFKSALEWWADSNAYDLGLAFHGAWLLFLRASHEERRHLFQRALTDDDLLKLIEEEVGKPEMEGGRPMMAEPGATKESRGTKRRKRTG